MSAPQSRIANPTARVRNDDRQHRRDIAGTLRRVARGEMNNTNTVSLAVSPATSTAITIRGLRVESIAHLQPQDSAAATELASGSMFWSCAKDTLNITHASSASARTFGLAVFF